MNSTLNLLPISFRKRLLIWAIIRQWTVCLCFLLILMGCWGMSEYLRMTSEHNRLTQLNAKADSILKVSQTNQILTKRSEKLSEKEESIIQIRNSELHLQILGLISQCTHPLNETVQVLNYKLEEIHQQGNSPAKRPRPQRRSPAQSNENQSKMMRLDLRGLAEDDTSLAKFIQALEKQDFFNTVQLKVVSRMELSSKMVRSYQIECTF